MLWSPSFVSLGFWYFPFLLKVHRSVTLDEEEDAQAQHILSDYNVCCVFVCTLQNNIVIAFFVCDANV